MSRHYDPKEIEEVEFRHFLQQLIKAKFLNDPARGITALVIDKGRDVLSPKQDHLFQKEVIERFVHEECPTCLNKIPWSQMFFAIDRGECADCDPSLRPQN